MYCGQAYLIELFIQNQMFDIERVYHFIKVNKEQVDEEVHLRNEHVICIFVKCFRIILSKTHGEHDTIIF